MQTMKTSAGRGDTFLLFYFKMDGLCRSEEAFMFTLALPEPATEMQTCSVGSTVGCMEKKK